ncbi:MAG TPA: helix-turn-helix transcriptional regulator, partial [Streptosporangiaceae bacterium]
MLTLRSEYRAADVRSGTPRIFRSCSCGDAFADLTSLDDHLEEYGYDSGHIEIALDLETLVRLGIRRIRIERGLTMDQMGELLGVSTGTISRIESGKRHAIGWGRTPRTVAVLLGVELTELLRICVRCGYRPPDGYQCHRCGMPGQDRHDQHGDGKNLSGNEGSLVLEMIEHPKHPEFPLLSSCRLVCLSVACRCPGREAGVGLGPGAACELHGCNHAGHALACPAWGCAWLERDGCLYREPPCGPGFSMLTR